MAKQVCDIKAGKGMSIRQSNEHLRVGHENAYAKKIAGTMDPTREHLNFEIGRGGVVKEVDKHTSISRRIKMNLQERGIIDPNAGLEKDDPRMRNTVANIILQGSTEAMRKMAFGDQQVNFERGADNSHVTRNEEIEKWAIDMYKFMSQKYGEQNIAAFVVHLDETNPHIHCTLLPITERGKFSYDHFFGGKDEGPEKLKRLHDELAAVNAKYGLERGDSVAVTGAKHKSYLQWLQEQIGEKKDTISEQDSTIREQKETISEQKQMLYGINAEIARANRKLKGLTSMVKNLETQKAQVEERINALEEEYQKKGEISKEEYEKQKAELNAKIADIDAKILDKQKKLEAASEQLRELSEKKHQLQNTYEDIQRKINKDLPTLFDKTTRDISAVAWEEAAKEAQNKYKEINDFAMTLPPEQRKNFNFMLENLFDGSIFEELAQRANETVAVASALFLGYLDQATQFAQSSGGGGGGPKKGWGKDKDEDDFAFMRRCFHAARAMMKPTGRKIKR